MRIALQEERVSQGYIDGFITANNSTDAANDIDIAEGVCADDVFGLGIVLSQTLTKQTDALFAEGNNAGGMDTGTKPTNGTLHIFAIKNPVNGKVDVLFSQSVASPVMPTGYTLKRRVASVLTDGSGDIVAYVQHGDNFSTQAITVYNTTSHPTSFSPIALSVPSDVLVKPILMLWVQRISSSNGSVYIQVLNDEDVQIIKSNDFNGQYMNMEVNSYFAKLDASIGFKVNANSQINEVNIRTHGWTDTRGKQ